MSEAWDRAKELVEQQRSDDGVIIRLNNDGDRVIGVFCGDPYAREAVWTGKRFEDFDPQIESHRGRPAKLRVLINFYDVEARVMRAFDGGIRWFRSVMQVRDKYGLDKWVFEIKRNGAAGDPRTTYTVLPELPLTDEHAGLKERIAATPLYDLEALARGYEDDSYPSTGEAR